MNNYEPLLKHLLHHIIILLGEYQRRLAMLDKIPSLDGKKALKELEQTSGDSIRLLHMLEPCLEYAIKQFPEFNVFLVSCDDAIKRIKKDNAIEGYNCDCNGCKATKEDA